MESFVIKDQSIGPFLNEYVKGHDKNGLHLEINYLKDELYVCKKSKIKEDQTVYIIYHTPTNFNGQLRYDYTYHAEEYDNVHYKLVLQDFRVSHIKAIKK